MQHRAEDVEEKDKSAPTGGRYRTEPRRRGTVLWMFPTYEVDLVTKHEIQSVPTVETVYPESTLQVPSVVLGRRWAEWKAKRMVAAAYKRDVREAQPWVAQEAK